MSMLSSTNTVQSVRLKQSRNCSDDPSGHICIVLTDGLTLLMSGLYAGVKNNEMWSDSPRWGRGDALYPCLMLL